MLSYGKYNFWIGCSKKSTDPSFLGNIFMNIQTLAPYQCRCRSRYRSRCRLRKNSLLHCPRWCRLRLHLLCRMITAALAPCRRLSSQLLLRLRFHFQLRFLTLLLLLLLLLPLLLLLFFRSLWQYHYHYHCLCLCLHLSLFRNHHRHRRHHHRLFHHNPLLKMRL